MKKKGFTLIELLVVIAIIAMLLAILMPALGKVKKLAMRLVCGTNVKGLANACHVYAFDYRDEFPIAGGRGNNVWQFSTPDWNLPGKNWAGDDQVSVAASLFMLVREADVGVKSFVCTNSDETPFVNQTGHDIVELWDFGGTPRDHQSYAYQIPYSQHGRHFPADGTSLSSNAIIADKNPWQDPDLTTGTPNADSYTGIVALVNPADGAQKWEYQVGNSASHDREGQNVLFGDGHVSFEKKPYCATRYDNIYNSMQGPGPWTDQQRKVGEGKTDHTLMFPKNKEDSVLVNDSNCNTN